MAFKEIKPGQEDWLNVLNDNLKNNKFDYTQYPVTLINGVSGWATGYLIRNQNVYIAWITGYITMPGNGATEIIINPFGDIMNLGAISPVGILHVGTPKGDIKFTCLQMSLDQKKFEALGDNGVSWDGAQKYTGQISVMWSGPASELKI
ncbi:hypothetical protein AALA17_03895 [Lactobacillaceae bacterium 24-114]